MGILWTLMMGDFWHSSANRAARRAKRLAEYQVDVGFVGRSEWAHRDSIRSANGLGGKRGIAVRRKPRCNDYHGAIVDACRPTSHQIRPLANIRRGGLASQGHVIQGCKCVACTAQEHQKSNTQKRRQGVLVLDQRRSTTVSPRPKDSNVVSTCVS